MVMVVLSRMKSAVGRGVNGDAGDGTLRRRGKGKRVGSVVVLVLSRMKSAVWRGVNGDAGDGMLRRRGRGRGYGVVEGNWEGRE